MKPVLLTITLILIPIVVVYILTNQPSLFENAIAVVISIIELQVVTELIKIKKDNNKRNR